LHRQQVTLGEAPEIAVDVLRYYEFFDFLEEVALVVRFDDAVDGSRDVFFNVS